MSKFLGDEKLPFACAKCGHKTQKTFTWLETHTEFTCPKCGTVAKIDNRDLKAKMADIDKAIYKLAKSFGKLGKR
jgi:predicted RNA-binding Zn-ribbon protein involved in translation (DUF1610 family)